EEQTRMLADEQDRHRAERESLLAQRKLLERELGEPIERLAAAGAVADRHEEQLQVAAARLRSLATELVSGTEELAEDEPEGETAPLEEEAAAPDLEETEQAPSKSEADPLDYALFVPGPNGYELVP